MRPLVSDQFKEDFVKGLPKATFDMSVTTLVLTTKKNGYQLTLVAICLCFNCSVS